MPMLILEKQDHHASVSFFCIYLYDQIDCRFPSLYCRSIAIFFMEVLRTSDKTLIMVRFIALAKTHLRIKDLHADFLSS